jgi:hypothetical protein
MATDHLITIEGFATELRRYDEKEDRLEIKSKPHTGSLGFLYLPAGTLDILNLGDQIKVEVYFVKPDPTAIELNDKAVEEFCNEG